MDFGIPIYSPATTNIRMNMNFQKRHYKFLGVLMTWYSVSLRPLSGIQGTRQYFQKTIKSSKFFRSSSTGIIFTTLITININLLLPSLLLWAVGIGVISISSVVGFIALIVTLNTLISYIKLSNDGVHTNMSTSLSFSGKQQKLLWLCIN